MKKIWVSKIGIYNMGNFLKGEINLLENVNYVLSDDNNKGKTLLASAPAYVLGNTDEIYRNLSPFEDENIDDILVIVDFFVGDRKFSLIRKSVKDNPNNINNKILLINQNNEIDEFVIGGSKETKYAKKKNLGDLCKLLYKEIGIENILSLNKKDNFQNVDYFGEPYLTSLLGFFASNEEGQNNEFSYFDSSEISVNNKYGIDGRIYSYLYLTGDISDEKAKMLREMTEFELESFGQEQRIKMLNEIILEFKQKYSVNFSNEITKKTFNDFKEINKKLFNEEMEMNQLLEEKGKLIKYKNRIERSKNKSEELNKLIQEKFIENSNRTLNALNDKGEIVTIKFSDVFPDNEFFKKDSDMNFAKEIDKNKEFINSVNSSIRSVQEKINILKEKLAEVEKPSFEESFISNFEEIKIVMKKFEDELLELNTEKTKISDKKKKFRDEVDNFYEELNIIEKRKAIIEAIKNMLSDINPKWGMHVTINDFPATKKNMIANTGSSKAAYSFSKLLFYVESINKVNTFSSIDFMSSSSAGDILTSFEEKLIIKIIQSSIKLNKQLIIYKNKIKKDPLFQEMSNWESNKIWLDNDVKKLISKKMSNDEIYYFTKILSRYFK